MSVFDEPRHPLVEKAVVDSREWCCDHTLNGMPAFARAMRVVYMLEEHLGADLSPELVAATLLHIAHGYAPAEIEVDEYLLEHYGGAVHRIVRALQAEQDALAAGTAPRVDPTDLHVVLSSTADKIVALRLLLQQSRESGDEARFFTSQTELHQKLPYLKQFQHTITGRVPESMSHAFGDVLAAITACRTA